MALDSEGSRWTYADTHQSGVYRVQLSAPVSRDEAFAVNVDTTESDLTKVAPEDLPGNSRPERGRAPTRRVLPAFRIAADCTNFCCTAYSGSCSRKRCWPGASDTRHDEWRSSPVARTMARRQRRRPRRGDHLEPGEHVELGTLGHAPVCHVCRRLGQLFLCPRGNGGWPAGQGRVGRDPTRSGRHRAVHDRRVYAFAPRTGLPTVAVVVDDSTSMGIDDHYDDKKQQALASSRLQTAGIEQQSRLNLAKTVLLQPGNDILSAIEKRYRLKLYFVSSATRPVTGSLAEMRDAVRRLEPRGQSSRLGAGLFSVLSDLRGTPPAAVVMLTDGINTDGESLGDAAHYARRKGVPVFTIALGSEQPVRDLELADLLVDEVVFVDDVVNFEYKLTGHGLAGKTVDVVLREKDHPDVLARMKVKIEEDGKPQRLHLPYRPTQVGDFEYVVEVEHLSDEVQADNNHQQRLVSVRKEQIRVLLAMRIPVMSSDT